MGESGPEAQGAAAAKLLKEIVEKVAAGPAGQALRNFKVVQKVFDKIGQVKAKVKGILKKVPGVKNKESGIVPVFGKKKGKKSELQNPPNSYGKKGGPLHQGKITQIFNEFKKKGYTVEQEFKVDIPSGYKTRRFGDLVVEDPNTKEKWIIQVGKETKAGRPVSRERKAIEDLEKAGYKVIFEAYNK